METSIMLKLFESIGFPAVIFVIWYIYHQAQVKTFEKIIFIKFNIKNAKSEYEPDWQWMEDYIKGLPYSGCL